MNFSPFNGHFPAVHQFAAAKFSNSQIQPGAMIVTSAADGTIQYIRPEHNGTNFIASSASSNPVQAIPVTVNIPVPSDARSSNAEQEGQHQLAAMVNTPVSKYPGTHSALLGWGDIPVMHHFNDANKNLTALNVPYPHQAMSNGAALLTMQPPHTSVANSPAMNPVMNPTMWPVKLVQSVATMTNEDCETQPQDLCKVEENKNKDPNSDVSKESTIKPEHKGMGDSEDDSDDSCKSGANDTSNLNNRNQTAQAGASAVSVDGSVECNQIQLQQQGSAMADYLARLPASTIPLSLQHFFKYQTENSPVIKREGEGGNLSGVLLGGTAMHHGMTSPKKKKKKKSEKKPPRPKPGEIRLSTALDGSTLFCCPECHMAYPDRELLEAHMSGHKLERKFVCNICGAGLKRKEHLDQHKKGHSDERPFVCSVCLKGFKRNEHLTRHFVIHSGEKSHACWECGKKFSRKDHLHKHTQTHIAKRVKTEMAQDVGVAPPEAHQSTLGILPPSIPSIPSIPNVPHPLQLHHAMP